MQRTIAGQAKQSAKSSINLAIEYLEAMRAHVNAVDILRMQEMRDMADYHLRHAMTSVEIAYNEPNED